MSGGRSSAWSRRPSRAVLRHGFCGVEIEPNADEPPTAGQLQVERDGALLH